MLSGDKYKTNIANIKYNVYICSIIMQKLFTTYADMDIVIDKIKDNLTIIDKDNITFAKGDSICNILIDKNTNTKFKTLVAVYCSILGLDQIESAIYYNLILKTIENIDKMNGQKYIPIDKEFITTIFYNTSYSERSIRRAITSLECKFIIIAQSTDGKAISNKYKINPKYDISSYFFSSDLSHVLITL